MKLGLFHFVLALAVVLPSTSVRANAADEAKVDESQAIELFKAIDDGLVEVKLTQKNSLRGSLTVTNKTDKTIVVDMPTAFAGVPVLAQPGGFGGGMMGGRGMGGMMGGMGGPGGMMGGGRGGMFGEDGGLGGGRGGMNSRNGGSGGNQSIGGGMGGGRGGMMGGGRGGRGGGGMFSIAPNKSHKESVRTVCLEHGKKEPRSSVKYTIVPIDSYTDNKTTQVLCSMLGDAEIDQNALQAAVWNAENGLSFEELAAKTKQEGGVNPTTSYFNANDLEGAAALIEKAESRAQELQEVEDAQEDLRNEPLEETDDTVETLVKETLN